MKTRRRDPVREQPRPACTKRDATASLMDVFAEDLYVFA